MKIRMISMALAALLCLASCSDDDSGIQLTEDEVVGDIITGKQIVINTLTTYTDSGSKVNVNGAKGKVSATSSDDSVAKVSCSSKESEKEIYVSGVSEGNATITVTDSDGNSAILKVEVKNWTARWMIYKTMYVVNLNSATVSINRLSDSKLSLWCLGALFDCCISRDKPFHPLTPPSDLRQYAVENRQEIRISQSLY